MLTYHYTPSPASDRPQQSDVDDSDEDEAEQNDGEDDDDEDDDQRLLALAEYQIHHFIRTQQVLNDAAARTHRRRSSRVASPTSSPSSPSSHRVSSQQSPDSSPETGGLASHAHGPAVRRRRPRGRHGGGGVSRGQSCKLDGWLSCTSSMFSVSRS